MGLKHALHNITKLAGKMKKAAAARQQHVLAKYLLKLQITYFNFRPNEKNPVNLIGNR